MAGDAPRVAILGRPNVGKSTLFNRLVGRRLALVDDSPGVTRDLREGAARLGDLRFTAIDTAGFEDIRDGSLPARMRGLSERAAEQADICLLMVDGRAGITAADRAVADLLRRTGKPVMVLVNKAEGRAAEAGIAEAHELGLDEVIAISAEHGEGLDELRHSLAPLIAAAETGEEVPEASGQPMRIAVIGRPNAGKSTLVNAILGEERLLTGPEAGITRDAIAVELDWLGTPIRLFDTAGMRKRARVQEKLEKLSVADGLRAVRFAEVVIVLLDADTAFDAQDLRLADLVEREGRAIVIAVNKWDAVDDRQQRARRLREAMEERLPQLRGAPLVFVSARTGAGLDRLHEAVIAAHKVWNRRVPTGELNRWLADMTARHPPPAPGGRRIKLRYLTQIKTRPPEFLLFAPRGAELPESYRRFLIGGLRTDFGLEGTPIRLSFRRGENPFAPRGPRRRSARR
ncbi:MAG: ribosome biogenesis GTPase Der [Alphaproteobacteria bacterium]|nr:MAG: ribosome biogenesis GTPase Der [Alphaproteobacteria bacterium]